MTFHRFALVVAALAVSAPAYAQSTASQSPAPQSTDIGSSAGPKHEPSALPASASPDTRHVAAAVDPVSSTAHSPKITRHAKTKGKAASRTAAAPNTGVDPGSSAGPAPRP